MKIKQAVIYRLKDVRKSVLIFYLIVFASYLLISFLASLNSNQETQMNGMEMASMIFLFVIGLNSFKPTFYLFIQNGVSRKTMFYSFIISMLITSGAMALIDSVIYTFIGANSEINTVFEQVYNGLYKDQNLTKILVSFVWALITYVTFGMIGYCITILYYRMNKILKLIVSISIPCLLFIALPIADTHYNGKITRWMGETFDFFFGTGADLNPFISMVTCCGISIIVAFISFVLVRRSVIKRT